MDSISKSDIDKIFGKILRDFRIKSGLTQEQLSEKLGISLKYISRIENGNNGIKTQTLIVSSYFDKELYKDFLTSPRVKENIELAEKLNSLPDEKKIFVSAIIDLLKDL